MFHSLRWPRSTIASKLTLPAVALSLALASPALAATKTITAVMHADLRTPGMMTTAYIVRDFGYMIFDTLLATDANYKIQPQMAEWKVSDDKLTYTFHAARRPEMA
jgi:peptide/nickel transport system substrate-binding protein